MSLGLLTWSTAEFGYARGLMDADQLAERATSELMKAPHPDEDLSVLAMAETADQEDIDDALSRLAARVERPTDDNLLKRWLLGHLLHLSDEGLDDEALLDALELAYAQFGYPEELRGASRYETPELSRAEHVQIGTKGASPIAVLPRAISRLQRELAVGA